jgi:antitoxin MazE
MKTNIIPIGNSKGIRLPKPILDQCNIRKYVILEIENENIILKPFKRRPRKNWDMMFKKMKEAGDDQLVIDDNLDLDMKDWE